MNSSKSVLVASAMALMLAGCGTKEEGPREQALERKADLLENQADVIREQGEAQADWIEKQDPGLNDRTTERSADANRAFADKRAGQLEDEADRLRDQK